MIVSSMVNNSIKLYTMANVVTMHINVHIQRYPYQNH